MGAEPYEYTVPYESDTQAALDKLRRRVFDLGQYNGAELNPPTPEAAVEMSGADGTRSILDITQVTESPDFCCAAPFTSEDLQNYFGTDRPTKKMVDDCDDLWDELERGMARYIVTYEGDDPREIFFVGYSFD